MKRIAAVILAGLIVVGGLVSSLNAQSKARKEGGQAMYYIQVSHTPEQCLAELDQFSAETPKILDKVQWGCMAGDHTGYAFVTASNENEARAMLPESARSRARVVATNKFSIAQIKSFHEKK
jgi:hypothetical protein